MFNGSINIDDFSNKYNNLNPDEIVHLYGLVKDHPDEIFEAVKVIDETHTALLYMPMRKLAINFVRSEALESYKYDRHIEKTLKCTVLNINIDDDATLEDVNDYIVFEKFDLSYNVCKEEVCDPSVLYTNLDLRILDIRNTRAMIEARKRNLDQMLGII